MEKRWQKTRGRVVIGASRRGGEWRVRSPRARGGHGPCVRARRSPGRFGSGSGSGGEGAGVSSPVTVECEAVDHEGVALQVEQLARVADAVGAAEPEGVIQVAVDALGVVAARVEPGE